MSNTPQIRFTGFTDAWEQRKFSDFTFPAGERNKDDLDLEPFAITNNQGFIAQSEAHDDFGYMKDVDRKMYIVVKPNSFAYNPARINVGSLGYYEGAENVIVSSLYEVFQTAEYVDDKFLKHWFKTKAFQDWIERLQEGSVRLYFYYDKLCECIMSMPSVEEQRKIGAYLDKIDNLITLHQRKCDALQKFKKSMLQKMFPQNGESVPEIRFAGFTDAWEQRKVGELCSISTGKSNTQDKNDDGIYPFYVRSPIIEKSNKYLYDEEAVITVGDGVGTGKVFHYVNGKYDLHQRCYRMYGFSDELNAKYFYHTFSLLFYKRVMAMTAKTSVDSVRLEMISDMEIPTPSIDEQLKIGQLFTNIDTLITLHQRKLEKLKNIKKSMLEKMFV